MAHPDHNPNPNPNPNLNLNPNLLSQECRKRQTEAKRANVPSIFG